MSEYTCGYDDGKGAVFDELMVEITSLRDNLTWTLHELKTSADRLTELGHTTLSARDCINRVEAALAKEEGK